MQVLPTNIFAYLQPNNLEPPKRYINMENFYSNKIKLPFNNKISFISELEKI